MFTVLLASTNSQETNGSRTKLTKNHSAEPNSVDSRFFGLGGGIGDFLNSFLPGFNTGSQGGQASNPLGMDFPANSQFYPNTPIQGQNPPTAAGGGQGNTWPVIDDASQFPNQGNPNVQPQYPPQGNFGTFPQYPPQGNMGSYPQNTPGNFGGSPQNSMYPQYPNQGNYGGINSQYPNFGRSPNQYPGGYPGNANQGNFGNTQPPVTSYPGNPMGNDFANQGGNWNQDPNNFPGNSNQGNFGNTQSPVASYPGINGGMPAGSDFSNQGGSWNPNPSNPGLGSENPGDGTLDELVPPPSQDPWNSDAPNVFNTSGGVNPGNPPFANPGTGSGSGGGRNVQIPPTTTEAGRINYPSSTESAAKRQCVQDCQTTSEYNPVCGSDNITYINPGKFVCARNCGLNVFVQSRGRCGNIPNPRNVVSSNFRPSWT
ncbi:hypothetical protein NE865_05221 [Phthorimaea operculella]|nr:hypothetical protein NE865_05221 [Phthorimaea operculella]